MSNKNRKKKKILYVITKSNWGGAQRYVFDLATQFAGKYEVAVALGGNGKLKTRLEEAGIRVISLPFLVRDVSVFLDTRVFFGLLSLFKKERPDIIHLNSSKISGLGALAGRMAKVPKIIFTAHGFAFREEWRGAFQIKIIKFFSWLTVLLSHAVITVSARDEREALSFPFTRRKILLVRNGISEPEFLSKEEARKILCEKNTENALWIGTIGELHKNKGHAYAIEALSKLPPTANILFFIIGEGEEKNALLEKIRENKLEEKVFLVGNKNNAAELLGAFDIFLFPSVKEGLPFTILESGLAGLPVIASAVGGIPEIITDMQTGILVRPKSSDEIIRALQYILHHEKESTEFGKKLRAVIKKDFSRNGMLRETEKVYTEEEK
jgi:glycosyltransferase involved in cell wall biosynthesis